MTDDVLLDVRELHVNYGGVVALDEVSLQVTEGAIVGLIGPNGAGKTTCIDALAGTAPARAGRLTFAGHDLDGCPPHLRARLGLVRTFQSLELFDDLTVAENLGIGAGTPTWWSTFTDAFRSGPERNPAVDETVDLLGLGDVADALPAALSNGERHRVALGRALAMRPRLLLLDEPAAGLDPNETAALAELLRRLPDLGITVLLVDHDMHLVFGVCDRVAVLDFGRIIAEGPPGAVRTDPRVVEAYLGTGSVS